MFLLKFAYEKIKKKPAPYYYNYSVFKVFGKIIRKWAVNAVAPNCVFNKIRILIYRLSGFKIGKGCFIGMKCYLDDKEYDKIKIGNNVRISYGVYFACHGGKERACEITIGDGAYIGMRSSIISRNKDGRCEGVHIGKKAIIGACTLVNRDIPDGATAVGIPCRVLEEKAHI